MITVKEDKLGINLKLIELYQTIKEFVFCKCKMKRSSYEYSIRAAERVQIELNEEEDDDDDEKQAYRVFLEFEPL